MKSIRWILAMVTVLWLVMGMGVGLAQQEGQPAPPQVQWQVGPGAGTLGDLAEVKLPDGHVFANAEDTRKLMEMMQNPISGQELGFLSKMDADWFLLFEFDPVGFIKDDEKESLDADGMLKSIQKGTEAANEERAKRGWAKLTVTGWQQPPRYNPATNNLEWAIRGESEGKTVINWNTRLLGRDGVMKVTLVADPAALETTLPEYEALLAGFSYKTGHKYAEFRQGDKLATYGLSALVVGGAAAVAAKSGLLKHLWKILVIGFLAVAGFLKKIFGRKKVAAVPPPPAGPDSIDPGA
jgi:uncharacterized membrane-anchored protein